MPLAIAGLMGLSLALVLTPLARSLAHRVGAVAHPVADRWHRRQVALLGGVGIAGAVLVGMVVLQARDAELWILLGGALALFVVGLVDDLRPLKPYTKFIAQIVVAAVLIGLGLRLQLTQQPLLDFPLTLLWIVGVTNAFNLLDNMDGLAAGVAAIATAVRLVFLVADGNHETALLAALLVGALVGFLVYNFHPASVFMGDAGSLFVGTMVGGLNLVGSLAYSRGTASVIVLPVLILLVPIFDTVFVMIARTLAGRSIATGGRDHPSHRLVAQGLSEREAVLVLYTVSLLSGAVAALSYRYQLSYVAVVPALLLIGFVLFGVYLGRVRVYSETEGLPAEDARFVTLVANFAHKRQVATVLLDLVLVVLAYYAAYVLRFEAAVVEHQPRFIASLPVVIVCQMLAFAAFRLHQSMWRYTGVGDLMAIVQGATLGVVATVIVLGAGGRLAGHSRSVFMLDWLLLVVLVSASRLSFRGLAEMLRPRGDDLRRALIYGAGDGGVMVLREMRNNVALQRQIVGFIDDDRSKQRTTVQGIPVLGGLQELEDAILANRVEEVIVSSSKVPPERLSQLNALCDGLEVEVVRAELRLV